MGIDGLLRRWWRHKFPSAWEVGDASFPTGAVQRAAPGNPATRLRAVGKRHPIVLFDYANVIKIPPPKRCVTWYDYFCEAVLPQVLLSYTNGAKVVYLCFERGSPNIKSIEHTKRYGNRVPLTLEDVPPITGTGKMPPLDRWRDMVGNRRLVREMVHYITHSFMDREPASPVVQSNRGYIFKPPLGCKLYIHGGQWDLGPRGEPVRRQPPLVYELVHDVEGDAATNQQQIVCRQQVCDTAMFPPAHVDQLLEAELACLYYTTFYPTANCMIVTPDGDLIPQLLLMARDRMAAAEGSFTNIHTIRLVGVGNGGWANCELIDVNRLYIDMLEDPVLRKSGVRDPVLAHCALCCLVKNDYIKKYGYGIGYYRSASDGDIVTPHIIRAFYRDPGRFANLFSTVHAAQPDRLPVSSWRQPVIDETLFHELTEHMYVSMYEERAAKKLKTTLPEVVASRKSVVHEYLTSSIKDARKHVMSRAESRVYARQLLWVLQYWLNNYRGTCVTESPTATKGGLSVFGWVEDAGMCRQAERVSTERPSRKRSYETMMTGDVAAAPSGLVSPGAGQTASAGVPIHHPRSPCLRLPELATPDICTDTSASRPTKRTRLGAGAEE